MTDKTLTDGREVELSSLLAIKEKRVRLRQNAQARFKQPSLSLTVVMPGPIKDCALSRQLAKVAREEVQRVFVAHAWSHQIIWSDDLNTGPETLYVIDADAGDLKKALVVLEETHPLGRLWDLDVHTPDGDPLPRRSFGIAPRLCMVCKEPAHACARSRAHSLEVLLQHMTKRLVLWWERTEHSHEEDPASPES